MASASLSHAAPARGFRSLSPSSCDRATAVMKAGTVCVDLAAAAPWKHCNHLRGPKGGDAERGHVHRLHRPELPPRHDLVELACEQPGNAFAATAPLPMPNPIIAGGSLPAA